LKRKVKRVAGKRRRERRKLRGIAGKRALSHRLVLWSEEDEMLVGLGLLGLARRSREKMIRGEYGKQKALRHKTFMTITKHRKSPRHKDCR